MVLGRLHRLYERAFKSSPGATLAITNALLKVRLRVHDGGRADTACCRPSETCWPSCCPLSSVYVAGFRAHHRRSPFPQTSSAQSHAFSWDARRSLRFVVFGLATGPLIGKWHEALEHYVPLLPPLRPTTLSPTAPTSLPFASLSPVVSDHTKSPYASSSLNGTPRSPKSPGLRPRGARQVDPKRLALFQAFQLTKRVLADQLIW